MKGVILAGGSGTRLKPMTKVLNKHLLPVYDKPMVYYPLNTLISAGITDIMIITALEHVGSFVNLLGSGADFGVDITYRAQERPGGIAQALGLAEDFVGGEKCMVVLGDNIIEDNVAKFASEFDSSDSYEAAIFLKQVPDPSRYGIAELDSNGRVLGLEEKPKNPKSNYAVIGLYMYRPTVFDVIREIKPSARGELEITSVNNVYLQRNKLEKHILSGFWIDAGSIDALYEASTFARNHSNANR